MARLFIVVALVAVVVAVYYGRIVPLNHTHSLPTEATRIDNGRETPYDYIVVGAGSSGSVVASRLAEQGMSVLLLEAGVTDDATEVLMPAGSPLLQRTERDWQYKTVPNKARTSLKNGQSAWPRGKTLGGSSSINYMLYVRGHRENYDRWARAGNAGWGYEDVLPYFKKSEGVTIPELLNSTYHGQDGGLTVSALRYVHPVTTAFLEGAVAEGIPLTSDLNGPDNHGVSTCQVTQRDGRRCSTAVSHLRPAMAKYGKNLQVATSVHVTRVLFEGEPTAPKAVGVAYRRGSDSKEQQVFAKREVILSAGAVNTPQLLLLSGVGPKEELKNLGIPVVLDSPQVGKNLADHAIMCTMYKVNQTGALPPAVNMAAGGLTNVLKWLLLGSGQLTTTGFEAMAFLDSGVRKDMNGAPDLQIHFGATGGTPLDYENFNMVVQDHTPPEFGMYICPTVLHPKSYGSVTLGSADPLAAPLMDPAYISDAAGTDLAILLAGMKLADRIAMSAPFKPFAPVFDGHRFAPKDNPHPVGSDEYWLHNIKASVTTVYHPTSTCRMGRDIASSVVDARLRVHGISQLRVVDASVMPDLVGANTNAPSIMIAEKAADLIAEDRQ